MRLSNTVRIAMAMRLLDRAFARRFKEHETATRKFLDELLAYHYPPEIDKKMNGLPAGAFETATFFDTEARGMRIELASWHFLGSTSLDGTGVYFKIKRERTVFDKHAKVGRGQARLPCMTDEHHEQGQALAFARKQLADDFKSEFQAAFATLKAFATVQQLRASWPEVVDFVADLLPEKQGATLPAIKVDVLNKKFDLPPSLAEIGAARSKELTKS